MNGITLRLARPAEADLSAIATVVNRAFLVHALMRGDRTYPDGLLEEAGPNGAFILAEFRNELVGSAMIRPIDDQDSHGDYSPPATSLYFGLAGVDTARMNSGIGRMLVAEAERIARERSLTHFALNTLYEFNLVPYYTRQGYVPMFEEGFQAGHWGLPAPHRQCHLEKLL